MFSANIVLKVNREMSNGRSKIQAHKSPLANSQMKKKAYGRM